MKKILAAVLAAGFLSIAGLTSTATAAPTASTSSTDLWKCPKVPKPFYVTYTAAGKPYVVKSLVGMGCTVVS